MDPLLSSVSKAQNEFVEKSSTSSEFQVFESSHGGKIKQEGSKSDSIKGFDGTSSIEGVDQINHVECGGEIVVTPLSDLNDENLRENHRSFQNDVHNVHDVVESKQSICIGNDLERDKDVGNVGSARVCTIVNNVHHVKHEMLLNTLLAKTEPINLTDYVFPMLPELKIQLKEMKAQLRTDRKNKDLQEKIYTLEKSIGAKRLSENHILVGICGYLQEITLVHGWDMCTNNEEIYLFNGAFWKPVDDESVKLFLRDFAIKLGLSKYHGQYYKFVVELFKQFSVCSLRKFKPGADDVRINLLNGTLNIASTGTRQITGFDKNDFLQYRLDFSYDPMAKAPKFQIFLDRVLPEKEAQKVLSEYMGYIFLKNGALKLEKIAILYGSGSNGKSVFFDIVRGLLGEKNISTYSPSQLMNPSTQGAQFRALIEHKLLNYSSEAGGKMDIDLFKKMVSGEPVDGKLLYKQPFEINNYAKLMVNSNNLFQAREMLHAFFRRLIIIPFEELISEEEQDGELAKKIIATELAGVFNWMLEGLDSLLEQKAFTRSSLCEGALKTYQTESDNVLLFLGDCGFVKSLDKKDDIPHKELFRAYNGYCSENGYRALANKGFTKRVNAAGYESRRVSAGYTFKVAHPKPPEGNERFRQWFSSPCCSVCGQRRPCFCDSPATAKRRNLKHNK